MVVVAVLFFSAVVYLFFQMDFTNKAGKSTIEETNQSNKKTEAEDTKNVVSDDGKWRYVTMRAVLGDYVPVTKNEGEMECKTKMDGYLKENGYSSCELIESTAANTPEECKESFSQGGCSICKFRCK